MEIRDLLDDHEQAILFLVETWLNETSAPDILDAIPEDYAILRVDRAGQKGGGIAAIFRRDLQLKLEKLVFVSCEAGFLV